MSGRPSHKDVHELTNESGDPFDLRCAFPRFDANAKPSKGRRTYIEFACLRNLFMVIRALISCGANLRQQTPATRFPLYFACTGYESSRAALVTWLLDSYADVRATLDLGAVANSTCLWVATSYANLEVVRVLLTHGANPLIRGGGRLPVQVALRHCNNELISLLDEAACPFQGTHTHTRTH